MFEVPSSFAKSTKEMGEKIIFSNQHIFSLLTSKQLTQHCEWMREKTFIVNICCTLRWKFFSLKEPIPKHRRDIVKKMGPHCDDIDFNSYELEYIYNITQIGLSIHSVVSDTDDTIILKKVRDWRLETTKTPFFLYTYQNYS